MHPVGKPDQSIHFVTHPLSVSCLNKHSVSWFIKLILWIWDVHKSDYSNCSGDSSYIRSVYKMYFSRSERPEGRGWKTIVRSSYNNLTTFHSCWPYGQINEYLAKHFTACEQIGINERSQLHVLSSVLVHVRFYKTISRINSRITLNDKIDVKMFQWIHFEQRVLIITQWCQWQNMFFHRLHHWWFLRQKTFFFLAVIT